MRIEEARRRLRGLRAGCLADLGLKIVALAFAVLIFTRVHRPSEREELHPPEPACRRAAFVGPYPTIDAACAAVSATRPSTPCAATSIDLRPCVPFSAAILRAPDTSDPRFAGSGAFFLALRRGDAWFASPEPLDRINGGAGHMFLPEISPVRSFCFSPLGMLGNAPGLALIRLRDVTARVCNVCSGHARDVREPVPARALWIACGLDRGGDLACTAPIETAEDARVTIEVTGEHAVVVVANGTTERCPAGF